MEERRGRNQDEQKARRIKRQIEWVDGREDEVKLILFVSINTEKKNLEVQKYIVQVLISLLC